MNRRGLNPISWVIAGGESGPGARPMHPDWAAGLLQQCQDANVPFHFKQWGHWVPAEILGPDHSGNVIEFEEGRPVEMARLPKKEAGRILNGTTWDGLPRVAS
jgi:protein gp37